MDRTVNKLERLSPILPHIILQPKKPTANSITTHTSKSHAQSLHQDLVSTSRPSIPPQVSVQQITANKTKNREIDIQFHCDGGNHQSSLKHKSVLDKLIQEDIEKGFALPPPIKIIKFLPNASLAPLGCHKQETISELGEHLRHCYPLTKISNCITIYNNTLLL